MRQDQQPLNLPILPQRLSTEPVTQATSIRYLETNPPMTTVASGRCTSAPVPVDRAIGTNPREATRAVMSTGRSLFNEPSTIASSDGIPCSRNWLIRVTITRPLRTATPARAMNPTAAVMEKDMPRNQSETIPPVKAEGTPVNTTNAYFTELKALNRSKKIKKRQTGTTTVRRFLAAKRFSNCPPQSNH